MEPIKKDILVVGHPRCGTGFMGKFISNLGYDIGHETMGRDGTSNWCYAIADEVCFEWIKEPRSKYTFDKIVHCIRDPFKAIPSIVYTETCYDATGKGWGWNNVYKSTEFRFRHLKIDYDDYIVNQAIKSYLGWNKLIEDMNPCVTVRIEHAIEDIKDEFTIPEDFKAPSNSTNARTHTGLSKEQWKKVDSELLEQLDEFCLKYNYPSIKDRIESI